MPVFGPDVPLPSYQLGFPMALAHQSPTSVRVSERSWHGYTAANAHSGPVHTEPCGTRDKCHWVPMLMHRDLLIRAGCWTIQDQDAMSYDIALDNRLGEMGVTKRMPIDELVLHMKHHLYINDAVDSEWADPDLIARLKAEGGPIL